ncbi:hypothetical protein K9L16_03025 [Candidatus Pacearchaeota archaeon]|nr:hypothetical protein [Candidatus Pacearchaeota archaeon]
MNQTAIDTLTGEAVNLTANKMTSSIEGVIIGLSISIILTGIGIAMGKGARREAKKAIGYIMGVIGGIGDLFFVIKLIPLLIQLTKL